MNWNAFVGGIEPGGLTNDFEVKILLCYLLLKIDQPISFELLNEILQETGFVNYFEFAEAISDLQKTGHLSPLQGEQGQELFQLTQLGKDMAQAFHHTLPLTVREKTVEAARRRIRIQKQLDEIQVGYVPADGGYRLTLTMADSGVELLGFRFFVPTEDQCVEILDRIQEDPLLLYKTLISLLLGNYQEGIDLLQEKL